MTDSRSPSAPASRALRQTAKVLPEHARRHNRSLVLQCLFHGDPLSRADLARETGLTPVTVSDLVGDLLADGFVEELGTRAESRVGKPATLVGLVPGAAHIVCLDLSDESRWTGAVLDLVGGVHGRASTAVRRRTGEAAYGAVLDLARDLVERVDRRILGIGVGTPGVVDADGVVTTAPNLGWEKLPLAGRLSVDLDRRVYVANDANAAALAEHTYGGAGGSGSMVVKIGKGVGAGLLLDGALHRGHHFAAGEIGHVVVDHRGDQCACGRRGCLETLLAAPALRARIAGLADDKECDAALAAVGRRFGAALAPVVSALDLREVVLSGPADLLGGALREAARAELRKRTMPMVGEDLDVRMASFGEDVVLAGAAVLVLSGELGVT